MSVKEQIAGEKSKDPESLYNGDLPETKRLGRNGDQVERDCACPEGAEEKCIDILCPRKER